MRWGYEGTGTKGVRGISRLGIEARCVRHKVQVQGDGLPR